jgi:hypothetical protein
MRKEKKNNSSSKVNQNKIGSPTFDLLSNRKEIPENWLERPDLMTTRLSRYLFWRLRVGRRRTLGGSVVNGHCVPVKESPYERDEGTQMATVDGQRAWLVFAVTGSYFSASLS